MPVSWRPNLSWDFVVRIDMASMQRRTMAQRLTWGCRYEKNIYGAKNDMDNMK